MLTAQHDRVSLASIPSARFRESMTGRSKKSEEMIHPDDASGAMEARAETALAWLEALGADHALLAELDPETLRRLREAAGRIAFP